MSRFIRKPTTVLHFAIGLLIMLMYPHYSGLSWILFIGFGGFEFWEYIDKGHDSYLDFLECVAGLVIGAVVLMILKGIT